MEKRLISIDLMRGLVMALMLLDHVREIWSGAGVDPVDTLRTWPLLFATRWVTHLCAPTFVLLTGVSAFLRRSSRGLSASQAGRELALRGLFLVALELTVVSLAWGRIVFLNGLLLQVIWALGLGMVILAGLQFLPRPVVLALSLSAMALHNLLPDLVTGNPSTQLLWDVLHQKGLVAITPSWSLEVLYPILPWFAVMALGWALGPLFLDSGRRRVRLVVLGLVGLGLFAGLRAFNLYGDPSPWKGFPTLARTLISFLNVEKYPPSLDFLCATLGLSFLLLALLDRFSPRARHPLLVFGRTPLFFYVVHLFANIAAAMAVWGIIKLGGSLFGFATLPIGGFPLWVVYLAWLLLLVPLYFACRAWLERRNPGKTWLGKFF